ncbi:MAG: type II toxin-antitoxin system RelE/ParE family toxin [Imperialibacter sp.]
MKVTYGKRLLKDIDSIQTLSVNLLLQETLESIESAQTIRDIPNIKKLKGHKGFLRVRLDNYRLGIHVDGERVTILRFLHRKEIYKKFP